MGTSKRHRDSSADEEAGPGPAPPVRAHVLIVHTPNADVGALTAFAARLVDDALPIVRPATGTVWLSDIGRVRALENEEPRAAVDFLDHALLTLSVLALTGGALTSVVVEEMVSEAHRGETSRLGPLFLTTGFALFAAISVYLGS